MPKKMKITVYCIVALCCILGATYVNILIFSHPATDPNAQKLMETLAVMTDIFCLWAIISLIGIYGAIEEIKKDIKSIISHP
jgi:hypothetical protein